MRIGISFANSCSASCRRVKLVNFYIGINLPHEYVRSDVADRAADDAQRTGEKRHIAEVERRLEKAVHSGRCENKRNK